MNDDILLFSIPSVLCNVYECDDKYLLELEFLLCCMSCLTKKKK